MCARLVLTCRRAPEANTRAALMEYVRAALMEDQRWRRCNIRGGKVAPSTDLCVSDADLHFLSRRVGPLGLLARAMLAYIFVEDIGKIAG